MKRFTFRLVDGPADGAWAEAQVHGLDAGCTLVFHGKVREHGQAKEVVRLEYQAYETMVGEELERIAEETLAAFDVSRIALEHSVGVILPGQRSVAVAIAAPHRREVFAAAAHYMDELKARAPLWKCEVYTDGSVWKGQGS
jgi:molybdopterin synthase catalytic subunit